MKSLFLVPAALAPLLLLARERVAAAEEARPIQIEYTAPAPPECPSVAAFRTMVATEVAQAPLDRSDWHYRIRVSRTDGGYAAALSTESGARSVSARTCEDATAALARRIAGAEPANDVPVPAAAPTTDGPTPAADRAPSSKSGPRTGVRVAARAQAWTHGTPGAPMSYGGMAVVSAEIPRGIFHRTLFEAAAGVMESSGGGEKLTYYVVDLQACPVDLGLGESGLSLLFCHRLAGSWFRSTGVYGTEPGGTLWVGAGIRLRWQSETPLFVELHGNAVYGTVSGPENPDPGWFDAGAMVGARL